MAGFLDAQERVIDMVLTSLGKQLLLRGELRFIYWAPFDDEVDYDPFIPGSGSLTADQLAAAKQAKTEDPLVREACSGHRFNNAILDDRTNLNRPMFTVPPRQTTLPRMQVPEVSGTVALTVKQQKFQKFFTAHDAKGKQLFAPIGPVDWGVQRFDPSSQVLRPGYTPGSYPPDFDLEGFLVTAYQSSSDGLTEVVHNIDSSGSIVYRNDLKVEVG